MVQKYNMHIKICYYLKCTYTNVFNEGCNPTKALAGFDLYGFPQFNRKTSTNQIKYSWLLFDYINNTYVSDLNMLDLDENAKWKHIYAVIHILLLVCSTIWQDMWFLFVIFLRHPRNPIIYNIYSPRDEKKKKMFISIKPNFNIGFDQYFVRTKYNVFRWIYNKLYQNI